MSQFPKFTQETLCAGDSNPEAWFPRETYNERYDKFIEDSTQPENLRAKSLCLNCPAYDECLAYSIQFADLSGIWAGLDAEERKEYQLSRRMSRKAMRQSYNSVEIATIVGVSHVF
jgi:hypothetical protein